MLAAVPEKSNNSLELVLLVLSMIAKDGQNVPSKLRALVVDVIDEAKALTKDPANGGAIKHPESILLALEMRSEAGLANSIAEITNFESIRPDIANRVLALMEHHPA